MSKGTKKNFQKRKDYGHNRRELYENCIEMNQNVTSWILRLYY